MRKLIFLDSAVEDFLENRRYIARESGNRAIGRRFVDQLRQQCGKMASRSVELGRPRPEPRPDIRSFAFKGYTIFFRDHDDRLDVENVLEGHRDVIAYFEGDDTTG